VDELGTLFADVSSSQTSQYIQSDMNNPVPLPVPGLYYSCIIPFLLLCYIELGFFFLFFCQVGKTYKAPYDNCTQYSCIESAGHFSLTSMVKVCLPFEESNCVPVSILEPEKSLLE